MDVNNEVLLYISILELLFKLKMHNLKFFTSLIKIKNNWNLYIDNNTLKVRNYKVTDDCLEIKGNYRDNVWIKEFKEEMEPKKLLSKTFNRVNDSILKNRTLIQRISNNFEKCSICLEILAPGNDLVLIKKHYCGNKFHLKCILKWQKFNKTCPLCRGDEFKDEYEDEEEMNIRPLLYQFTNSSDEDFTDTDSSDEGSYSEEFDSEESDSEESDSEESDENSSILEQNLSENENRNLFSEVDSVEDIGNITINKIKEILQISNDEAVSIYKDTLINLINEFDNVINNQVE